MATKHGTRRRYNDGCHCGACTAANNAYLQEYRQRRANNGPIRPSNVATMSSPVTPQPPNPGPVEFGVEAEIAGLVGARPGLAQVALALARILDNPKAVNQRPAAARQLVAILSEGVGDVLVYQRHREKIRTAYEP